MTANLYNIAAYQVAWFACVLSAAAGRPWLGTTIALVLIGIHVARASRPRAELELIAVAAMIGLLVDSALISSASLSFSASIWAHEWAPYWMVSLWGAFATTLNHSLRWLTRRPVVAALFGAVGGPIAYAAGVQLGALEMPSPQRALPAIGVAWAVAMWALAAVAARANEKGSTIPVAPTAPPRPQA
jgi:hypothetical protein